MISRGSITRVFPLIFKILYFTQQIVPIEINPPGWADSCCDNSCPLPASPLLLSLHLLSYSPALHHHCHSLVVPYSLQFKVLYSTRLHPLPFCSFSPPSLYPRRCLSHHRQTNQLWPRVAYFPKLFQSFSSSVRLVFLVFFAIRQYLRGESGRIWGIAGIFLRGFRLESQSKRPLTSVARFFVYPSYIGFNFFCWIIETFAFF